MKTGQIIKTWKDSSLIYKEAPERAAKAPGRIEIEFPNYSIDALSYALDGMRRPRPQKEDKNMEIKTIYVNEKKLATTVLWEDGTHTTVKLNREDKQNGKKFDVYSAVCAAIAKRVIESNSKLKKIIKEKVIVQGKQPQTEQTQAEQCEVGKCNVEGFVADEWYRENFKGE